MKPTTILFGLILLWGMAVNTPARSFRPDMIPNAHLVPGAENRRCIACHMDPNPRTSRNNTERNAFGKVVETLVTPNGEEAFWGPELAAGDADGDGVPNGVELGDPDGLALHRRFGIPETENFPLMDPPPDETQLEVGDPSLISNPGLASSVPPGEGTPTATPTATPTPTTASESPTPTSTPSATFAVDADGSGRVDAKDILKLLRSGMESGGWFQLASKWQQVITKNHFPHGR